MQNLIVTRLPLIKLVVKVLLFLALLLLLIFNLDFLATLLCYLKHVLLSLHEHCVIVDGLRESEHLLGFQSVLLLSLLLVDANLPDLGVLPLFSGRLLALLRETGAEHE